MRWIPEALKPEREKATATPKYQGDDGFGTLRVKVSKQ